MHTIDTIMPSLANLRVHIAPVGFEVDRIVIPAKNLKADKVWYDLYFDISLGFFSFFLLSFDFSNSIMILFLAC